MIICLNPNCQKPENPDRTNFCLSCGTGLVPLLRDRYRIISLLGSGGFGRTFLAEDTDMPSARRCVIKQLKPINNPQIYQLVQERFQREAAVLEQLGGENPNIPSLYAYFILSGQFYLVQQWIDGETLTSLVKKLGNLNEKCVKFIITKLLEVLDYVHNQGIIHRDIKPDNIIVRCPDDFPVLIDYGAVKETMGSVEIFQGATNRSIIIGTQGYMPSEQLAGKPVYSSDLYGVGLTAIYALTGKVPQELPVDQNTSNFLWNDLAQNVSLELIVILDKAIQWYPRDRYPKAKDMLDALQSGVSMQPSPQPSVSQRIPTSVPPHTGASELEKAEKYHQQGMFKAEKTRYQEAIDDFSTALFLNPNSAKSYQYRGIAHSRLDTVVDIQYAIQDLKRATSLYKKQKQLKDHQEALSRVTKLEGDLEAKRLEMADEMADHFTKNAPPELANNPIFMNKNKWQFSKPPRRQKRPPK